MILWGFMPEVRAFLMWRDFRGLRNRFTGKAAMRHCGAWLLCALLLILCASAKLARYEIHKDTLKLASTQTYLDGEETLLKELSKTTPVLWFAGIIAVSIFIRTQTILLTVVISSSTPFKGFDPESRLRPPPLR
jgi:hypothetical protein